MTIEEAIKRPFQNIEKLAIGTIISAVPLVNLIAVGYFLECFRRTLRKDNSLPEWNDWSKIILDGLKAAVIQIVYAIPLFVLFFLVLGGVFLGVVASVAPELAAGNAAAALPKLFQAFAANIGTLIFGIILIAIASVIVSLLSTAATVRFAQTENFNSGFALGEVKSIGLTLRFLITVIIAGVVAGLVAIALAIPVGLLTLIPVLGLVINFLGSGLITFVAGVISWTILAERYARDFTPRKILSASATSAPTRKAKTDGGRRIRKK